MKRLSLAGALLALPLLGTAQTAHKTSHAKTTAAAAQVSPAQRNADAVKEVEALERQRFAAQVSKDYTFLEKAFADDLSTRTPTASRTTRRSICKASATARACTIKSTWKT